MAGSTEGDITSDKCRISGDSSGVENLFVRGANTVMKTNGTIEGDSETRRKKFTARQWEALIGFCGVETRKQFQKIWKQI